MPVIWRDDDYRIDLAIVEDAAKVAKGLRFLSADLLDLGDRSIEMVAIDVADCGDPGVGLLEELAQPRRALQSDPDHAEHDLIVWPGWNLSRLLPGRQGWAGERGERHPSGDRAEERTSRDRR